jgi:protein-S-isoprenylcysteine O-methyltransferase Ste14
LIYNSLLFSNLNLKQIKLPAYRLDSFNNRDKILENKSGEGIVDWVTIFKILQISVIFGFVFFISDIRKKNQAIPLVNERFTKILKISYLIPVSIYSYILLTINSIKYLDYLALVITSVGLVVAALAKISLSNKHTWTGYCLSSSDCFIAKGIYIYIRHPLYTGIFLFSIGGLLTVVPTSPWFLSMTIILSLCYILSFLTIIARKETQYLIRQFGEPYIQYSKQVHPFLPLRRFKAIS